MKASTLFLSVAATFELLGFAPPNPTPQSKASDLIELKRQRADLEVRMDELKAQQTRDAQALFDGMPGLLDRWWDWTAGKFLGSSQTYKNMNAKMQQLEMALRSGNGAIASGKAVEVGRIVNDLLREQYKTVSPTGVGTPVEVIKAARDDLKGVAQTRIDLVSTSARLSRLESYPQQRRKLNDQIDAADRAVAAWYNRPIPPKKATPAPTVPKRERDLSGFDDAIALLKFAESEDFAFGSDQEREAFYQKFPSLRQLQLSPDASKARDRNQAIVERETLRKPPVAIKPTADGGFDAPLSRECSEVAEWLKGVADGLARGDRSAQDDIDKNVQLGRLAGESDKKLLESSTTAIREIRAKGHADAAVDAAEYIKRKGCTSLLPKARSLALSSLSGS